MYVRIRVPSRNPRYNGPDTMRGNIQDMQISGAFPIIFGVLGGKGFEKDGAHMSRAFAYLPMHNLHTEKFASRVYVCTYFAMETSGVSRPVDRKKFGYRYILLTLVSSSHRYAYNCLLKGYGLKEGEGGGVLRRSSTQK